MTQTETIRAFRRTWKPKAPKPAERRAARPAYLRVCPPVECESARPAQPMTLPPPGQLARSLLSAPPAPRSSGTGVRRRPEAPVAHSTLPEHSTAMLPLGAVHSVPPPLPSKRNAQKQRNTREPTDPCIEILTIYEVPPVPRAPRARRALPPPLPGTVEIELQLEDLEEVSDLEAPASSPLAWLPRVLSFARR